MNEQRYNALDDIKPQKLVRKNVRCELHGDYYEEDGSDIPKATISIMNIYLVEPKRVASCQTCFMQAISICNQSWLEKNGSFCIVCGMEYGEVSNDDWYCQQCVQDKKQDVVLERLIKLELDTSKEFGELSGEAHRAMNAHLLYMRQYYPDVSDNINNQFEESYRSKRSSN